MASSIAVVMPTYNGALYVEGQIRSLQRQDVTEWRLYVRDDGSSDGTRERVAALARVDRRIKLLEGGQRLGAVGNFGALLAHARDQGAGYVFPCDQDDVWHPTKMSRALAAMVSLERARGPATPLLVHSDLEVVNEKLETIHPSFLQFQGLRHEARRPLRILLVQNFVTGCASLLNRPLLELALPIPPICAMHDWWTALLAAAAGAIGFLSEPTLSYRQHEANEVGAGGRFFSLRRVRRHRLARSVGLARAALAQAAALHARLLERAVPTPESLVLEQFSALGSERLLCRVRTLRRLGIRRQSALETALLYALLSVIRVGRIERAGH